VQVSRKEMMATLALRFGGEGIVKIKGVPFRASPLEVRKFFSGFRIRPGGVVSSQGPPPPSPALPCWPDAVTLSCGLSLCACNL
jgi:hypothetical protein